jgi:hypothetical protein
MSCEVMVAPQERNWGLVTRRVNDSDQWVQQRPTIGWLASCLTSRKAEALILPRCHKEAPQTLSGGSLIDSAAGHGLSLQVTRT